MTASINPGIYTDMDNAVYHQAPGVSKSGLDLVARAPALYKARYIDGIGLGEETPAMALGSAVHAAVLEPDKFDSRYAAAPEGIDRRTKAGKEAWAEFKEQSKGKTILSAADHATCLAMRDTVWAHKAASRLLEMSGNIEASIFWHDQKEGVLCKCRPDKWLSGSGVIVDLKTTTDASPRGFSKAVANYRYHVQAVMYCAGTKAKHFVFIVVEKSPPYMVALYTLDDMAISVGHRLFRRDLATYAECLRRDTWPGYSDRVETISLPLWAETIDE